MRLSLLFLFLSASVLYGQDLKQVVHHLEKTTLKKPYLSDSLARAKQQKNTFETFRMNGFVGVVCVDTMIKKSTVHYYYEAKAFFKRVELITTKRKEQTERTVGIQGAVAGINNELKELENNGFPFAQVKITDQVEKEDVLQLTYEIDSGEFVYIDKIHLKSQKAFHEKTLLSIIGIKPGDPYNEGKIRLLPEILRNTNLFTCPKAPEVLFREGRAELYVYFEKKKSSSADGYIGFQQDRVTNRLALNGYINLALQNALNRGERIAFNWKNNPDKTQDLKMDFEYPYLFGSPLGVASNIDLQKQDTSFIRSDIALELTYRSPQFRVGLFDEIEASTVLTEIPLPGFRDYSKNTIGVRVLYRPFMPDRMDFYQPTFFLSGGVFNYRTDTLDDNAPRINNNKYEAKFTQEFKLLKYFKIRNSLAYQGVNSSIGLARNEFIYFGGLQDIRGFYELELSGRENWLWTNEFIFQPIQSLSMMVLYDYANFRNTQKNYSHSVGIGFGFQTEVSQLQIIVANGTLNNNPFLLSNTKVHLGFVSTF